MSKTITKETATEKITNIVSICLHNKIRFSLFHRVDEKALVITGTTQANHLKTLVPAFELKLDSRQTAYAELVINYE